MDIIKSIYNKHLKEFNSKTNGELHQQDWVGPEMDKFHEKINKLKNNFCNNCHELWPSELDYCKQCQLDLIKYSKQNDMLPNLHDLPLNIKSDFEKLSTIEELLISPVLSVMSIFRLPGGQLLSRGYVANFSQKVQDLCIQLPRKTSSIPVLIVKRTNQNNESKEFKVNKKNLISIRLRSHFFK